MSQPNLRAAPAIALLLAVTACASARSSSTHIAPASASPSASPSASLAPPADAAPAELQGRWLVSLGGTGNTATLVLRETRYQIVRGAFTGTGKISVSGDKITFSGNDLCEGSGTYMWVLKNDTLTFTVSGPKDPCPRIEVITGGEFTQVAS